MLCINLLHYLDRDCALRTIKLIKNKTVKGGINIVVAFTKEKQPSFKRYKFLLEPGMLRELYKDWKIFLHAFENIPPHTDRDCPIVHKHSYEAIVAGKSV